MTSLLQLEIIAIEPETFESKTFILKSDKPIDYKAGQFLTFLFQRKARDLRRSYSFSSSPDKDDFISITLKQTLNGEISYWWMNIAKVGDLLKTLPPSGMFTVEWQKEARDIFLVAAGSGIVPLYSILKSAIIKEPQSHITLIYANKNPLSAIFLNKLEELQNQYSQQITIIWLYSSNQNLLKARLGTYNFQSIVQENLKHQLHNALLYTCGPEYFMQTVFITGLTMGFAKNNIRKEIFDIREVITPKRYFDTAEREITILFRNKKYILKIPYNRTILDTALQYKIDLPYSCGAGRCSTCRCKVLNGKVWMHYNEVLTDADEAAGYALTCTGHPASPNVIIEIK